MNNEIWELRPLRDRILFAHFENNSFILLSVFVKQTQKTPRKEIKRAENLLKDFRKRSGVITMDKKPYVDWKDVKKNLNISDEQAAEVKLEEEIIEATITARKKCNLTQRELSEKSGVKQPAIARIEKGINSPQTSTLIKLLFSMGYTLKVVPLDEVFPEKRGE